MKRLPTRQILVTGWVAAALLVQRPGFAAPSAPVPQPSVFPSLRSLDAPDNDGWLPRIHTGAISGVRSHLPAMIKAFRDPPDGKTWGAAPPIRLILLHSFALLNATEAIPALDEAIAGRLDTSYADNGGNAAVLQASKAVRARILAQKSAVGIKDPSKRAAAQMQAFLQELDLTPDDINGAVTTYWRRKADARAQMADENNNGPLDPVELYAMRELADMIYHGHAAEYSGVPEIRQIDFTLDPGAGLKFQLAPLSSDQRINALVDLLSAEKVASDKADFAEQLLSDIGEAARPALKAKHQDIKLHPEHYHDALGMTEGPYLLYNVVDSLNSQAKGAGGHEFVVGY